MPSENRLSIVSLTITFVFLPLLATQAYAQEVLDIEFIPINEVSFNYSPKKEDRMLTFELRNSQGHAVEGQCRYIKIVESKTADGEDNKHVISANCGRFVTTHSGTPIESLELKIQGPWNIWTIGTDERALSFEFNYISKGLAPSHLYDPFLRAVFQLAPQAGKETLLSFKTPASRNIQKTESEGLPSPFKLLSDLSLTASFLVGSEPFVKGLGHKVKIIGVETNMASDHKVQYRLLPHPNVAVDNHLAPPAISFLTNPDNPTQGMAIGLVMATRIREALRGIIEWK